MHVYINQTVCLLYMNYSCSVPGLHMYIGCTSPSNILDNGSLSGENECNSSALAAKLNKEVIIYIDNKQILLFCLSLPFFLQSAILERSDTNGVFSNL